MYKILLVILVLLLGCSQTKVEKDVKVKTKVNAKTKLIDQNKTSKKDALSVDFVPKHIRLSHIEVVPH